MLGRILRLFRSNKISIRKSLAGFIDSAVQLGLSQADVKFARELLEHSEYALSYQIIVDQIGNHDIEITQEFYDMVEMLGKYFSYEEGYYYHLKEMIRNDGHRPPAVTKGISNLLSLLLNK